MTISAAAVLNGGAAAGDAGAAAGGAAAGEGGAAGSAAGSQGVASNGEWFSTIGDESVRTWVQSKGFKDSTAVAESAYNLEKLIGFDKAGRTLVVPKDDATPEERAAFYQKLGAPANADGYKVPEALAADPVVKEFRDVALKSGMLPKQFEEAVGFITAKAQTMNTERQQAAAAQSDQDMTALKTEWGQGYDKQVEMAKRAATSFIPAKDAAERGEIMTKIEGAIGTGAMMRLFAKIGEGLGEHAAHSSGDAGNFDSLTPAQAKGRIEALKSDKEWSTAYLKGDKIKIAEMERLTKAAYPG